MSGMFGQNKARREARRQAGEARQQTQEANEEAARSQQQAERGGSGGRGRQMMVGMLADRLKKTLGG